MSREERKMAQIIASIERMEQRKAPVGGTVAHVDSTGEGDGNSSGGSHSNSNSRAVLTLTVAESPSAAGRVNSGEREMHAQTQKSTRLGAKGRRLKPLSTAHGAKVKASGSSSKRAKPPQEQLVGTTMHTLVSCRLTPKKRWIQLWNEQQSSSDEAASVGESKAAESATEPAQERFQAQQIHVQMRVQVPVVPVVPVVADEMPAPRPVIVREDGEESEDAVVLEDGEAEADEAPDASPAMPLSADASLSSPSRQSDEPKETSISPVSSVKESLKESPAALTPQKMMGERLESSEASLSDAKAETSASAKGVALQPALATVIPPLTKNMDASATASSPSAQSQSPPAAATQPTATREAALTTPLLSAALDATRTASEPKGATEPTPQVSPLVTARDGPDRSSRKRSLERKEPLEPLTEDERRRAERRRVRRSNWDVGDPRFAFRNGDKQAVRSPTSDDMNSSSTKFPPAGRPAWRHSSSMDATFSGHKASFAVGGSSLHRSSFSGTSGVNGGGGGSGGPSRRPFYASNSLPLDRSRSAGRSAAPGYHHSNSYR